MIREGDSAQEREWGALYDRLSAILRKIGREEPFGKGDYWLLDENWGLHQHKLEVQSLSLLKPTTIKALQNALAGFHDWEIVVAVHAGGSGKHWPAMGLIVRDGEIIDGLRRQYFPPEFQDIQYEGSRPGTDRD